MGEMLGALRSLGVGVVVEGADRLPFTLTGVGRVPGGIVTLDASASSQFVSALLLAGARYHEGVDVRHVGKPLPSLPHIAMTVAMLRERGVSVDDTEPNRWQVAPGPDRSRQRRRRARPEQRRAVPGGGRRLWWTRSRSPAGRLQTHQPGDQLRWILGLFGAEVELGPEGLTVTADGRPSRGRHRPARRGRADPGAGRHRRAGRRAVVPSGHLTSARP